MDGRELVNIFNSREVKALDIIYEDYYRMLVLYAMNYLKEQMQAEDSVQESLISIWQSDITFNSHLAFKTYLYNTVKNRALNLIRHQKVKNNYAEQYDAEDSYNDEEVLIKQEYYSILFSAIERLEPKQREIIELNLINGGKLVDIAESIGISYRTAKRRKEIGVKELRKMLEDLFVLL